MNIFTVIYVEGIVDDILLKVYLLNWKVKKDKGKGFPIARMVWA